MTVIAQRLARALYMPAYHPMLLRLGMELSGGTKIEDAFLRCKMPLAAMKPSRKPAVSAR
jgi:hypothetical protein